MRKLLAAAVIAAAPFAAFAGTASDDFTITATVDPYCEIENGASDISVSYNPFDTSDVTASTTTEFNCVKNTGYTISVNAPSALTGSTYGESLNVSVSPTSGSGTDTDGLGGTEQFTMNITIPAGQDVATDTYSGTVTVDINY
ncbi:Spore Coat Protein U domain-containing protein [Persephonella hydrogeniphila]|uniref:Spore Coat Protein U domain-containing protein n=1 Tax=Persephonella hydrogeniphila TaxID=198703 RepID=A0A285NEI8_9AQUI|nr:spore coat protein U domain-containing protein [Persephonella hydrogeniphila]SNZ07924.1 Spore Coat Protein U domain-containing protein [Persephonella hydrogeniphila]